MRVGTAVREALRSVERRAYRRIRSREAWRAAQPAPVAWSVDALAAHSHCLLITRRRDGRTVPTPVWFALDGDAIVIRSGAGDAKVRRVRANPSVLVCPCTARGRPLGPPMAGRARILDAQDGRRAERALRARYGWDRRAYTLVRDPLLDVAYLAVEAPP